MSECTLNKRLGQYHCYYYLLSLCLEGAQLETRCEVSEVLSILGLKRYANEPLMERLIFMAQKL